jgi:hypothetical protein
MTPKWSFQTNGDIFGLSSFYQPASIEELASVPNVTANDWKQAGAFSP